MPKSSRLTRTPMASSWARTAAARGGSVSSAVSVISMISRSGGTSRSASTAMTWSAKRARPRVRADTLTDTATCPRSRTSVSALRITQVVSRSMRSVCSHRGMNRSGYSRPRVGCCQRTRASTASTCPSCEGGLGLVVHDQLAGVDGAAQLGDEPEVGRVVVVVLGVVAHHPDVLGLGDVHGHIGVLEQVVDVDAVVGRDDEADARLDRQGEPAHLDLVLDDVAQAPQHLLGVARRRRG